MSDLSKAFDAVDDTVEELVNGFVIRLKGVRGGIRSRGMGQQVKVGQVLIYFQEFYPCICVLLSTVAIDQYK